MASPPAGDESPAGGSAAPGSPGGAVHRETDGAVAVLTLDRPRGHLLGFELLGGLEERLAEVAGAEAADPARVLVLTGAGGAVFSAGADVRDLDPEAPEASARRLAEAGRRVVERLEAFPGPVIAAVDGLCLGGGLELALACSLRIAGEGARFGLPEIQLGILPGWGATQALPRAIGPAAAADWIYTGEAHGAATAARLGLVSRVVPEGEALAAARELARELAAKSPVALAGAARALAAARGGRGPGGPAEGGAAELDAVLTTARSEDGREGIRAFLERRRPRFTGR